MTTQTNNFHSGFAVLAGLPNAVCAMKELL